MSEKIMTEKEVEAQIAEIQKAAEPLYELLKKKYSSKARIEVTSKGVAIVQL